jgi:hypothetical protein
MSLLDDAYRRHLVLKTLASEESTRALANPSALRHVAFEIVQIDDSAAKQKIETFFEDLGRRIDEVGFLDQFVAFETLLNEHRKKFGRRRTSAFPRQRTLRNT